MTAKAAKSFPGHRSSLLRGLLIPFLALAACATPKATPPVSAPPVQAAAMAPAAPEPALPLDPAVAAGRMANGLSYYVRQHGRPEKRVTLRLVVNAGAVLETEEQRGLAHFVEHMAFNGTRRFKKQEIVDYLEKVGVKFGQHTNAYTGFDETVYMLQVPSDDPAVLDRGVQILREFASEVSFDPAEVDKERGVVIEEWRLGRGADARVLDQQMPIILKGSRYAERMPIGKKEVLETATAEDLRTFYRTWYRPDQMAVVAVGDVEQAALRALIEKHFGSMPAAAAPAPRPDFAVPAHDETLVAIATDKELTGTTLGVLHKLAHRPQRTASDYRRMLVERLYHHMMNARLTELTRRADAPFFYAGSSTDSFVRSCDAFMQFAVVKQDGVANGLRALTREIERVERHGFLPSELERARRELQRGIEAALAERDKVQAAAYADELVRHHLVAEFAPGIEHELRLHQQFLPGISLGELNGLARQWVSEKNRVVVVSAPADAPLPTAAQARALLDKLDAEAIEPYQDRVRQGPLVEVAGAPVAPVSETALPDIGAFEWRLPNGIRVVLKPTDFKNDEVLMTAFSPGGHSLVTGPRHITAEVADDIIEAGGLGEFAPDELEKTLSGKIVSVSPYIGELEEGLEGGASPKDLETLFQLIHLSLTAPRADAEVFAAWKAQQRDAIVNRTADPGAMFGDRFLLTLFRNHPRRQPPSVERLEKIDLDEALAIYRERFSRLGDLTFVFVGAFDLDAMKPLVGKYLGQLPPLPPGKNQGKDQVMKPGKPLETWRDVGARPPARVETFTVEKGLEPKSQVLISWNGDAGFSRKEAHVLRSMTDALAIRLREVLREELGGTYGVSVRGALHDRPRESYRIDVQFACAPENVDKLTKAVFSEIDAIKKNGFADDHVVKVKTTQRRALEEAVKRNEYWRHALSDSYRRGDDPRSVLETPALIDAVDATALKNATRRYFNPRRYVMGVLKPESSSRAASHESP